MSMHTVGNDNKLSVTSRLGQQAYHGWRWGWRRVGLLLQVRVTPQQWVRPQVRGTPQGWVRLQARVTPQAGLPVVSNRITGKTL